MLFSTTASELNFENVLFTKPFSNEFSEFIYYNNQKLEIIKMSFNGWMIKKAAVYPNHEILFRNKKEQTINPLNHLDRFQETEWKRPISENHILHDSTYVTFSKSQSYIDKEQFSSCQG